MKWITRSHVHVDRVACPWLIKRFVDSEAQFIFVTAEAVEAVAKKEGATPFDVKGAELGHKDGHCSFVSVMERYGLKDPALLALAEVVNAADTDQFGLSPCAAGLEALAQGFSLLYPDDKQNMERQFQVYDALYAFFRVKTARNTV